MCQRNQQIDQYDRDQIGKLAQHRPFDQHSFPFLVRLCGDPLPDAENQKPADQVRSPCDQYDQQQNDRLIQQVGGFGAYARFGQHFVRPLGEAAVFVHRMPVSAVRPVIADANTLP